MMLELGWLLVVLLLFMYLLRWDHYELVTGYLNPPISPFGRGGIGGGFYVPFNSGFQISNNYFKRCRDKIKFVIKEIVIKKKVIKEKIIQV